MERLQKVIASSGYTSRRKAEELILEGRVKVNNKIITKLGVTVSEKDSIKIDDIELEKGIELVYYLLNKPRGVITSTSDEFGRKTVLDIIKTNTRIYPVGRLDYDTTGLIILTNDGELANHLMHPKNEIEKVYIAKIDGIIGGFELKKIKDGVYIDGIKTAKARAKLKSVDRKNKKSIVELTIHEGRNHQVKKMFEAVGYNVEKLKRERYGFLTLDGLKSGEFRKLNKKEVKQLYNL